MKTAILESSRRSFAVLKMYNFGSVLLQAPFIGPTTNGLVTPKFNGVISKQACISSTIPVKASNDVGVPVSRQMLSPVKAPQTSTSTSSSSATTLFPQKHKKISFGITTPKPFQAVQNQMPQPVQTQDSTGSSAMTSSPRIVMHIKNGKVTTIEKSPDGKSKVVKGSPRKQSTLVPYDDDSDSAGEGTSKEVEKKPGDRGPRVALNFSDQEKENHISEKISQGAFNMFTSSSSPAKNSPKREKGENHVEGLPHKTSTSTTVKPGGLDSVVLPRWDLTLKLNRDSSSGLKKMSIDTQSPTKVNSTTSSWFVQAKDSAPSPSLASCSSNNSNHSVNSTTEWSVEPDSKANISVDRKPQTPSSGWTVTQSPPKGKKGLLVRSESLEDSPKRVKKLKRSSSLEPVLTRVEPVLTNGDGPHSLDGFSERTSVKKSGDPLEARADLSCRLGLNPDQVPNCNGPSSVKESSRLDFPPCSKNSPDEETADQKGHRIYSDKRPLLESEDSPSVEKVHKKHKKKKHKRDKDGERSKVKYTELQESMTSEDGQSRRKHKKKKKHKRSHDYSDSDRKEKRRREREDSDSDHKRKRHSNGHNSDDDGLSTRKRKKSESSDSEYTWEERTKETLLKEKSESFSQSSDKPSEYCWVLSGIFNGDDTCLDRNPKGRLGMSDVSLPA